MAKSLAKKEVANRPPVLAQNVRELVARADLEAVDTVRIVAERLYADRVHGGTLSEASELHIELSPPTVRYPTEPQASGAAILVDLVATWRGPDAVVYGQAALTVRVAYRFLGLDQAPAAKVVEEFANELGLHHAWPFLRERLRTLSAELGLPAAILPLRKR